MPERPALGSPFGPRPRRVPKTSACGPGGGARPVLGQNLAPTPGVERMW
jgi:hypothetical protein